MPNSSERTIIIAHGYIVAKEEDKPFILKIDHITKVAYLFQNNRVEFSTSNGQVFDIPYPLEHFETLFDGIVNYRP